MFLMSSNTAVYVSVAKELIKNSQLELHQHCNMKDFLFEKENLI